MSMSDTLGDMITRIRNGQSTKKNKVDAPASRFRKNVLEVLKREGYIRDFSEIERKLIIDLKQTHSISLAKNILRAETAAISAITIVNHHLNLS